MSPIRKAFKYTVEVWQSRYFGPGSVLSSHLSTGTIVDIFNFEGYIFVGYINHTEFCVFGTETHLRHLLNYIGSKVQPYVERSRDWNGSK